MESQTKRKDLNCAVFTNNGILTEKVATDPDLEAPNNIVHRRLYDDNGKMTNNLFYYIGTTQVKEHRIYFKNKGFSDIIRAVVLYSEYGKIIESTEYNPNEIIIKQEKWSLKTGELVYSETRNTSIHTIETYEEDGGLIKEKLVYYRTRKELSVETYSYEKHELKEKIRIIYYYDNGSYEYIKTTADLKKIFKKYHGVDGEIIVEKFYDNDLLVKEKFYTDDVLSIIITLDWTNGPEPQKSTKEVMKSGYRHIKDFHGYKIPCQAYIE